MYENLRDGQLENELNCWGFLNLSPKVTKENQTYARHRNHHRPELYLSRLFVSST